MLIGNGLLFTGSGLLFTGNRLPDDAREEEGQQGNLQPSYVTALGPLPPASSAWTVEAGSPPRSRRTAAGCPRAAGCGLGPRKTFAEHGDAAWTAAATCERKRPNLKPSTNQAAIAANTHLDDVTPRRWRCVGRAGRAPAHALRGLMDIGEGLFLKAAAGEKLSNGELEALLKQRAPEDQFLDYMSGRVFAGPGGAAGIRRSVASFANGEGGLIVIGVNAGDTASEAERWTIDGCQPTVGKRSWGEWLSDAIAPVSALLTPPPRWYSVETDRGMVVVVVVFRSDVLVPVREGGPVYYVRFGDGARPAPDSFVADMALGRWRRPHFRPAIKALNGVSSGNGKCWLTTYVTLYNASLTWAEEFRIGLVAMESTSDRDAALPLEPEVGQYVEVLRSPAGLHGWHRVVDARADPLPPFGQVGPLPILLTIPDSAPYIAAYRRLQTGQRGRSDRAVAAVHWPAEIQTRVRFGVYIACRNSVPAWFQGDVTVASEGPVLSAGLTVRKMAIDVGVEVSAPKLRGGRAAVSLNGLSLVYQGE